MKRSVGLNVGELWKPFEGRLLAILLIKGELKGTVRRNVYCLQFVVLHTLSVVHSSFIEA